MSFQTIPLTATDIKAIRLADSLTLHCDYDGSHTAQLVKRPTDKDKSVNPFVQDAYYTLPCGVTIGSHYKLDMTNADAREYISLYADSHHRSVLATLKPGDAIVFTFNPDYGTTDRLRDAGFHFDVLTMDVYRTVKKSGDEYHERTARFELESRISDSRYRMVRGIVPRVVEA
jgi:hypothetical protein